MVSMNGSERAWRVRRFSFRVGWWKEGPGGAITTLSLLAFYLVYGYLIRGKTIWDGHSLSSHFPVFCFSSPGCSRSLEIGGKAIHEITRTSTNMRHLTWSALTSAHRKAHRNA